jgi:putative aldouronate transport system permease protein
MPRRKVRLSVFDACNLLFLLLVCFATFYPFWNQLVISFSTPEAYFRDWFHVIPRSFSLYAYRYNFQNPQVFRSFAVSVLVTAVGTVFSMFLTTTAGYFLSKGRVRGRNLVFLLFILTMFIDGGLVPTYILVTRMGFRNSLFALFIPNALNIFYIVLMKNYFMSMPESLEESARLDGANDLRVLAQIVVPVSRPIMATISLFYAVYFWNDWFHGMIYISRNMIFPLSLYLRGILSAATSTIAVTGGIETEVPATVRSAIIMITIVPIVCVYPFLQKHFIKGIMLGATKE